MDPGVGFSLSRDGDKWIYRSDIDAQNVARIPWLPPSTKNVPVLRNLLSPTPPGSYPTTEDKIKVLETFARVFPPYLPARYHKMEISDIHKHSVDLCHWDEACNYVSIILDRATIPFHNLKRGQGFSGQAMSGLKSPPCASAAEFLMELCVQIQMPFQPAVLHQWTVAAYTESLIYSKKLIEIGTRGYASEFHEIYTKLVEVSQKLSKNCNTLFKQFFQVFCEFLDQDDHMKARWVFKDHPELLADTLVTLEFVMSEDCKNILNFIKNKSWSKDFSPLELKYSSDLSEIGSFNLKYESFVTVYSDLYWQGRAKPNVSEAGRGVCNDICFEVTPKSRFVINFDAAEKYLLGLYPDIACESETYLELVKNCVMDEILKNGLLVGMENTEDFVAGLENYMEPQDVAYLRQLFMIHWSYKKVHNGDGALPIVDAVINQVLSLQSEVFAEHALGEMTRLIWRSAKKFQETVFLDQQPVPVLVEFSLEKLCKRLKDLDSQKEQWSLKRLLDKTKYLLSEDLSQPILKADGTINLDIEIGNFTALIRQLVFSEEKFLMITLYAEKYIWYSHSPERKFIQYIFPCFVATFIDLHKDSEFQLNDSYSSFLYALVKNFNEVLCCLGHGSGKEHMLLSSTFQRDWKMTIKWCSDIFKKFYEASQCVQTTFSRFIEICERESPNIDWLKDQQEVEPLAPTNFQIAVNSSFCRIFHCLEKIGFSDKRSRLLQVLTAIEFLKRRSTTVDKALFLCIVNQGDQVAYKIALKNMCHNENVKKSMMKDLETLTLQQLLGISLYQTKRRKLKNDGSRKNDYCHSRDSLFLQEYFQTTVRHILSSQDEDMKKIITDCTSDVGDVEDNTLIPFKLAKQNSCCQSLLKSLNYARRVENPAKITFFPIMHCRKCGLVESNSIRLCTECKDEPNYHDPHYFCSEKCETDALDEYHREKHADFVEKKLQIDLHFLDRK